MKVSSYHYLDSQCNFRTSKNKKFLPLSEIFTESQDFTFYI